ncbi:hypothetical protein RRG08_066078 [Elysia crispata]|uniref:Uncharacterized protein n=1 Tax=Elysia crispata TaxID=231223 RepID=A0AAE1CX34_9GAST|nr:hypothetical protein RRG08_066078 [Elysia crispata]
MTPLTERFATVLAEDDDGFTLFKAESLSYVENSEIPEFHFQFQYIMAFANRLDLVASSAMPGQSFPAIVTAP